jgi:hypothetical protein
MSKVMRALGCAFLAAISVGAVSADEIKNWTAPPYWIPETVGKDAPEILLEGDLGVEPMGALPSPPLPLTAMNPCRIVDTRNAPGPFGGPALVANATRTFSIPSGPCAGIPSDASAYSLNFTVIGGSGVFTNAFLTAWPTGDSQPTVSTLNFNANQLEANAAVVPAGTSGSINVFVNAPAHLLIDINGYYAGGAVTTLNGLSGDVTLSAGSNVSITPSGQTLTVAATSGPGGSLPVGTANQTLRHNGSAWVANSNLTNDGNTVTTAGSLAVNGILKLPDPQTRVDAGPSQFLYSDTENLFLGSSAGGVSSGQRNTGIGNLALLFNTLGTDNTAVGYRAMNENLGGNTNTAVGSAALDDNDSGSSNIAIGYRALSNVSTGNSNIGIGVNVGTNISSGSNNIYIGNAGFNNESGQIRIGDTAFQTGTVIVGIYGAGSVGGIPVIVNPGGRLGTTTSSVRFKQDVRDIGGESDGLMSLRPVAFKYKPDHEAGGHAQYGLIAEEVAEIYPELVVYDDEGKPFAIRSQLLDPLLLNEIQKQHRSIERQQAEIETLRAELARLQAQLAGTGVVRQ